MVIEEIILPKTFVKDWTSIDYCKASDFFFRLIFLVISSPSLTIMSFPHSSSMNTSLGAFSKFPMTSISIPSSSSSAITASSEGLSSTMKL